MTMSDQEERELIDEKSAEVRDLDNNDLAQMFNEYLAAIENGYSLTESAAIHFCLLSAEGQKRGIHLLN